MQPIKKVPLKLRATLLQDQKIIFDDDFSKDGPGDFPAHWNTTGSGAVTTINGLGGKWFSITHNSVVAPETGKTLPENCTIEFDLFLQNSGAGRTPRIEFGLTPVKNILKEDLYYKEKFYVMIDHYDERNEQAVEYGLRDLIGNKNNFPLTQYENEVLHVAMAINGSRIRVYFDGEKLIDLPRALTSGMRNNFFITNVYTIPASEQGVLVGNVRITEATNDARSSVAKQLKKEGKFTTNDILFDVNNDIIKTSSYTLLNEIGETLQQKTSMKIKIIGHTDADGEDKANQILSEKRAIAVKNYLQNKFSIAAHRMTTVGMGES
nr:OmpA family protein [Chryseobacterium sp. MFBS3-17]